MEVHAHTHTPRKKWTHYFWEFIMLFLAVFCGFLAENKREHIVEHHRAKEFAKMLKADLIEDTIQMNNLLEHNDSIKVTLDIFEAYYNTPVEKITFRQFKNAESRTYDIGTFIPNDATYSQMKSSGSLRYFKDAGLLRKLALYEAKLKNLDAWWKATSSNHGGLNSEHVLHHGIQAENFLKKNPELTPETLIMTAGYKFESWQEATLITWGVVNGIAGACDTYPEIKKIAGEIINLLDKEFHLK